MSLDVYLEGYNGEVLYEANITHNLTEMANQAGLYKAVWRPIESGYILADDIIDLVEIGLNKLKSNPDYYKQFDAANEWGTYDQFVPWLENYLDALLQNCHAFITISR